MTHVHKWRFVTYYFGSWTVLPISFRVTSLTLRPAYNWPNSQIPQPTCSISHYAPFSTEIYTFLFWKEHCGIWNWCILRFVKSVSCHTASGATLNEWEENTIWIHTEHNQNAKLHNYSVLSMSAYGMISKCQVRKMSCCISSRDFKPITPQPPSAVSPHHPASHESIPFALTPGPSTLSQNAYSNARKILMAN